MKRFRVWFAVLFCLVMCLMLGGALAAQSGDYYYQDNGDGTCTILDYAGRSIAPVFPSTLNSLTVTGIGENVFRLASGSQGYMGIMSVTLPDTVTTIAANAFEDCGNMETITLGSGLQSIGEGAFSNCKRLTSITLPESVTFIGEDAFLNCSALRSVYASSLESWLNIEFGGLYSHPMKYDLYFDGVLANDITIPSAVKEIRAYAFHYCTSLETVKISDGVETIGSNAFLQCSNLKSVVIPASVTRLQGLLLIIAATSA